MGDGDVLDGVSPEPARADRLGLARPRAEMKPADHTLPGPREAALVESIRVNSGIAEYCGEGSTEKAAFVPNWGGSDDLNTWQHPADDMHELTSPTEQFEPKSRRIRRPRFRENDRSIAARLGR